MSIDPWIIVGAAGTAIFAGRWLVQVVQSHKKGQSIVTKRFWIMSISGSLLTLSYFVFGKRDPIGIISNLFPAAISAYNLILSCKKKPSDESDGLK